MDTAIHFTVLILAALALLILLYQKHTKKEAGKNKLWDAGYEHIFSGGGDNFLAFNTHNGLICLGRFPYSVHRELPISYLYNFEWKWIERNANKGGNRFVFYLSDISYPMHEIHYYDKENRAEYEWAKLQAVYRTALSGQYEQIADMDRDLQYDFFVSHASEDKDSFVRPLVHSLEGLGLKVWYDERTLEVGDSLRRSIDIGLARSKYGIVVLSRPFFDKQWPQYELDGLVTKSIGGGKVILPVWHGVSHNDVAAYSLSLADTVAFSSALLPVEGMAREFLKVIQRNG